MTALREMGYTLIGLDGEATNKLDDTLAITSGPVALVLGAEGPGLRELTKETCSSLAKIDYAADFGSLNVSNAAAISLYAASKS
jgi:23S rRNA (guanosine2251-2'-O)-methyltransferase